MADQRPNPDELLAQVQAEEQAVRHGRLKVFFGACAGVGKTYTMLEAAHKQKADGVDVVIGYVEPHARPETLALLEGLEALPVRPVEYRGTKLTEFDLDAALSRKPALAIVDELAHSNAPGSRHVKRWQDIMELLDAGVNVYTTLNVQHIETLNDVVAQLSGVRVHETVPDTFFDQADEVELVDLPPDELLQRLAEGKIYLPERASVAVQNFFQKGNLVALRELALRRTAERVNVEAEAYRHEGDMLPTADRLLVCVGTSPMSARLVRAAARMAASLRAPWLAVSVVVPGMRRLSEEAKDRIRANLQMAARLGAEVVPLTGQNVVQEVLSYARATNVTKIIVGKPTHPRWRDTLRGSLVYDLVRQCGPIDVYVISGEEGELPHQTAPRPRPNVPWPGYLVALLVVAACTVAGELLAQIDIGNLRTQFDLPDIVMVYLLGVIGVALRGRRGPALLASILSASALNFFFIPPLYSFTLANPLYWVTVLVLAVTGIIVSTLVVRIRNQADAARERELRTVTLYALSRELSGLLTAEQVSEAAERNLGRHFQCDVVVLLPGAADQLAASHAPAVVSPATLPGAQDLAVAQWVVDHAEAAGLGTDTLPASPWLFVPLTVRDQVLGVIGLRPRDHRPLPPDQEQLLTTLAALVAGALERLQLAGQVRQAEVRVESEKMRSALLSSVSHDLRTPLTGILGAAGALAEGDDKLPAASRKELLQTITEEAERVNRLVGNLLEITRLESGQAVLSREWLPVEELVGSAVRRCDKLLTDHPIRTLLAADLPMIRVDSVLMEQVLVNLLDNAAKYSPPGQPIDVAARTESGDLVLTVADLGPGVPPSERRHIFEKFIRLQHPARVPGAGLGLAICQAIVAAHLGRIWVEDRPGGGAVFSVSLPLETEPQVPQEAASP